MSYSRDYGSGGFTQDYPSREKLTQWATALSQALPGDHQVAVHWGACAISSDSFHVHILPPGFISEPILARR